MLPTYLNPYLDGSVFSTQIENLNAPPPQTAVPTKANVPILLLVYTMFGSNGMALFVWS